MYHVDIETTTTFLHNESMPDTPLQENDNPLLDKAIKANERRKMLNGIFTSTIMKVVATVFLLSTLFSAAFLIAWQQVQKQNYDNALRQIPDARVVIPNIVDYANQEREWKTYTNEKYNFEIQYPGEATPSVSTTNQNQYIRIQNYENSDSDRPGLSEGQYYIEIFLYDHALGHKDTVPCDKQVLDAKSSTVGQYTLYRGKGEGGGDSANYIEALCVKTKSVDYTIYASEDISKYSTKILDTFKFTTDITPSPTPSSNGKFCGGIAAIKCPDGYSCKLDGSYPDSGGACVANSSSGTGTCKPTGCSGEICSDQDMASTCIYREEYACYTPAKCERQGDGKCGWTQTNELKVCVDSKN